MNMEWLIASILLLLASNAVTYIITKKKADRNLQEFKTLSQGLTQRRDELKDTETRLTDATTNLSRIDAETKELQALKSQADQLANAVESSSSELANLKSEIAAKTSELLTATNGVDEIRSTLDLYTRIEDFVAVGHFEMPEYLHETSERFAEEIKRVREQQKEMIKAGAAVTIPEKFAVSSDPTLNKRIMDGQMKLVLSAFNIECDFLIGKVSPSNFARTLERIEKLANNLEKAVANLHCGIDIKYIELKYEECRLQYQFTLKKKDEQEEQRLIREQIREEQKAIKEYERALAEAEKEERMYRDMLEKAKEELGRASEEERAAAEQRIADLERRLSEAEAKEERAKSMAEQTRKAMFT
jgi:septal ring factor EnvC (AmiA/AmiB activator)